ncbi:ead/Ea22-like family protein [Glutamicibacter sp. MCAF14]|uniref:ead/Ea22-like family protein n=1 Tax=Glutamicibacter sp. MCAF14 TaxID=3233043 RepID=UPI003F931622
MTINLDTLRKIAEAATPGPWETLGGQGPFGTHAVCHRMEQGTLVEIAYRDAHFDKINAVHIATFDPPTVLALLSRVEKAERSCRLLGTIIERDGKNLVELTNSQDIIPEDGDGDWEVVWERAQEMKDRLEQAEQAVGRVREVAAGWATNDRPFREALLRALDGDQA